jgi:hypothetical protein
MTTMEVWQRYDIHMIVFAESYQEEQEVEHSDRKWRTNNKK